MADAAAQKREARRRRILENSENRLKRITGSHSNDGLKGSKDDTSDGRIKDNEPASSSLPTSDSTTKRESENVESSFQSLPPKDNVPVESLLESNSSNIGNSPISTDFVSLSEPKSSPIYKFCWKARTHIIALAIIVRILLTTPCAALCGQSAVLPLLTIESAEWIYAKLHSTESEDSPSGLFGMAIMLCGIAPKKVTYLLRILNFLNSVCQDFLIYCFVFSLTHVLLEILSPPEIMAINNMFNYFCLYLAVIDSASSLIGGFPRIT